MISPLIKLINNVAKSALDPVRGLQYDKALHVALTALHHARYHKVSENRHSRTMLI
jgi:hypothetical protein